MTIAEYDTAIIVIGLMVAQPHRFRCGVGGGLLGASRLLAGNRGLIPGLVVDTHRVLSAFGDAPEVDRLVVSGTATVRPISG